MNNRRSINNPEQETMVIVRSPVRISFGGGGTDLAAYYTQHGGLVLSTSITRYCCVIASELPSDEIRISSADYHTWKTYHHHQELTVKPPLALPEAVLEWFFKHKHLRTGVELFLASEVPPGTGLGSSSAMTVALITALATLTNTNFTMAEIAELACQLEIERLRMPIGKQDQYASAIGGLNTIEFSTSGVQVTPVQLPEKTLNNLNQRLMLFASGQQRNSADILGQQRRNTEQKITTIETLHQLKALAIEMRQTLCRQELDQFGILLDQGWHLKKTLANSVSSQHIDQWYTAAQKAGAIGGKIAGAGGGGFLLLYCPPEYQTNVRQALIPYGLQEMSFNLDCTGPQIINQAWPSQLLTTGATCPL